MIVVGWDKETWTRLIIYRLLYTVFRQEHPILCHLAFGARANINRPSELGRESFRVYISRVINKKKRFSSQIWNTV